VLKGLSILLGKIFSNATVRYIGGVVVLLGLGTYGIVWGVRLNVGAAWLDFIHSLSEAFLVSGILAIFVDPYLKRQLEGDSMWSAVFAYLNPKAPGSLRRALQELAACKRYYPTIVCSAHFAWANPEETVLAVTMDMYETGISLEREPYKPGGRPWVLASTDGWRSDYLRYSLSCPSHIRYLDVSGADLERFITREDDGSITLDQARIVDGREIPSGIHFERHFQVRMYRHVRGYVPFTHNDFVEKLTISLSGPALRDIDVRVTHPKLPGKGRPSDWKRKSTSSKNPEDHVCGRATPGQTTLVSWYPVRDHGELL
jgi:hypothetical protein